MFKTIVFDCMETVVDMKTLPSGDDYALWAFIGSDLNKNVDRIINEKIYLEAYAYVMDHHRKTFPENTEYNILTKFEDLIDQLSKQAIHLNAYKSQITESLYHSFWETYLDSCYVSDEKRLVLEKLVQQGYKLGIASNFTVPGGIEEILKKTGVSHLFEFVVSSVDIGVRKPDRIFFENVIKCSKTLKNELLFVGDDYKCDFIGACNSGIQAILYDKQNLCDKVNPEMKIMEFKALFLLI